MESQSDLFSILKEETLQSLFLSADKFNDLFTNDFCIEEDLLFFQLAFIKGEKA